MKVESAVGPLARMADARMYFNCWERASAPSMLLNGVSLTNISINGHYITNPLRPTGALAADSNTLVLVNASDGGTDIEWPGIQVMVQYNAPVHAHESIAPKASARPFSASVDKNGIKIAIAAQGIHWLRILDAAGECVARRFGTQPCGYRFDRSSFAPGLYVLDVRSGSFHARNTLALTAY